MNDLFKKLNVLAKASLNDRLKGEERAESPRLGKHVDDDIAALRERINDAVKYEDEIKARIRQFEDEGARWDAQADEAVTRGDDASARYAVEQMRRAEQRATMAQADLREHQQVTQELIQRINTLDAYVADARHTEQTADTSVQPESASLPDLGGVLRDARDKIASMTDTIAAQRDLSEAAPPQQDDADVDDDLDRRRQRLSKR